MWRISETIDLLLSDFVDAGETRAPCRVEFGKALVPAVRRTGQRLRVVVDELHVAAAAFDDVGRLTARVAVVSEADVVADRGVLRDTQVDVLTPTVLVGPPPVPAPVGLVVPVFMVVVDVHGDRVPILLLIAQIDVVAVLREACVARAIDRMNGVRSGSSRDRPA